MMKYLDIRGYNILYKNGQIKGVIDDCILDDRRKKINSIVMIYKHFMTYTYTLSLKNIKGFGEFIIYDGDISRISRANLSKSLTVQSIMRNEILDTRGKRIGNLVDIIFDEKSGDVKALICSRGFFDDIFEGRKIVLVDDETIFTKEKIIVTNSSMDIVNDISFKKFLEG